MSQGMLSLGSFPKLVRHGCDMIGIYPNMQRRNKSNLTRKSKKGNFVEIRKTKTKMRLSAENKEQQNVYKQLVHDYKPFTYINKDKPQEEMPQILNKKVMNKRDLGTKSREIDPISKKAVHFMKNKNFNKSPKKFSWNNMMNFIALGNLVHDGNQPDDGANENTPTENKICKRNKNLLIETTVDVLEPQNDLTEMPKSQSKPPMNTSKTSSSKAQISMSELYKIYGVAVDHDSRNSSVLSHNKKVYLFYGVSDEEDKMRHDIFEKHLNKNVLVNTHVVGSVKPQNENCEDIIKMSTFSTYDSDKEGFSLYEDAGQIETLPGNVIEKQRKEDALVQSKIKTRQCSAPNTIDEGFSLYEDPCQIESLPSDTLKKEEALEKPKIETLQCLAPNTSEQGFSLYEDACQVESLPSDASKKEEALEKPKIEMLQCSVPSTGEEGFSLYEDACQIESLQKPTKQSIRLKETASLMALVQSARQRSRTEYFETCLKSLSVTVANKPTYLPPLGPPPVLFPPIRTIPPLPACPKNENNKESTK